jgi:hypothetical protein
MTTTEFGSLGEPVEQTQIRVRKAARLLAWRRRWATRAPSCYAVTASS